MFSLDLLLATLLAVTAAALLLYVFTANAHSFTERARDAQAQADAFIESENALKTCEADGGAALCEGGVVLVNEIKKLPDEAYAETKKENRKENENRVCVTRIALFGGKQTAVQYCAERGDLK